MNNLDITHLEYKENTDRLYFDQYRYCLKLRMTEFHLLREIRNSTASFTKMSEIIKQRFTNRQRYTSYAHGGIYGDAYPPYANPSEAASVQMSLDNLIDMLLLLVPVKDQIKPSFSGDWGYVYSNDKTLLKCIAAKYYVHVYHLKEAIVSKPKNTIVLKSSPYLFRSYFKAKQYTQDEKTRLLNYLETQPDLKISRGLYRWLKYGSWSWSRRHHYFDHSDSKIELMLRLIYPDAIRITMPIIEVNN